METVELRANLKMADMELDMTLDQGECQLSITDTTGDEQVTLTCTPEQAAAIWFLAINGDDGPEGLIGRLYGMAEPVVWDLPLNLRPIP